MACVVEKFPDAEINPVIPPGKKVTTIEGVNILSDKKKISEEPEIKKLYENRKTPTNEDVEVAKKEISKRKGKKKKKVIDKKKNVSM